MLDILSYIGEKLNNENIVWGVGASVLLNYYGLIESKPNDIDILVDIKDIHKVEGVFNKIGKKKEQEETTIYSTRYFYEYIVKEIDIDIMAGLVINHITGKFEYNFDENSIVELQKIKGVDIPFNTLEDWYVIYQLIPNRESRVKRIEDYLISKKIKNPLVLEWALENDMPIEIANRIKSILAR